MSYHSPPPTSAFSGAVRSSTPDTHQRPPSVLMEKLNLYSPDIYAGSPPTASPLQPYPVQAARFSGRSYSPRPESPAQIGKTASGWSFPQAPAPESPLPVQKTFKTFLQWKAEAQATTADYQRDGFPSPVAWVYVEGHAIPPNAIVGGVDRKGPWYIVRVFYEGSLELGKAGRHLRLGACISYHGKERDVDTYEVLVEANLPTRWVYQSLLPPSPVPVPSEQPIAYLDSRPPPQLTLADFKLVVIVDDSDSMDGRLWIEARDALASAAELTRLKGGEGLDVYCLNSPAYRLDLRSEAEVIDFFNDIVPEGQTPTGSKLRQILDIYVPRIENPSLRHKPITILVITDGVPTDDPGSVIVEYARRLDERNVPLRQLGIQFIQIGDDADASEALKELDDQLGPDHGVRDMVDTTPFSQAEPFLHADLIIKVVLGAINARAPPIASPLQPYPVQATQHSGRSHSPRPESPAQIGKTASGWSFPQSPAPESPLPVQKTFKTFLQWKAAAQATTADYQRNGFPSPAAWVYVEGHAIPPNAIVGGVDRKGPWYIVRVFYEGSLELGKAGRHFRLGACISYHGKERDVDTYEVLVEANLPTRWVYQSLLPPPPVPRPEQPIACLDSRPPPVPQLTLADFKLVVIVDDSDSMDGRLWIEARDALAGVAELTRLKGGEGLDIYCLNSPAYRLDLRNEVEVFNFFNDIVPEGQTPTGNKLRQILDIYVPRIENPSLRHKPISILVITDGVPTDDPRSVIVEYARRLDVRNVPLRQLGIQFVQIGDDADAAEALKELDDQLGPDHGVRDMVDTTPFSQAEPSLRADLIIKVVLGAINDSLDNTMVPQSVLQY